MGRRLAPETLSRSFPGLLRGLLLLSLHEGLSVMVFPQWGLSYRRYLGDEKTHPLLE